MIRGDGWESRLSFDASNRRGRRVSVKDLSFRVHGYTGWDVFLGLLPERWQVRVIARRLVRSVYRGVDLEQARVLVIMPRGTYRVLDAAGRVELTVGDPQAGNLP